ncbi:MAG: helix-turn-helix domain-containing protein [Acidimicrobiales bacterium]
MEDHPDWLKPIEAARRLGLPTRELYRLIDRGEVPAYKFGRTVRLLAADVEEYLRRRSGEEGR